jgi:hypothetical protein
LAFLPNLNELRSLEQFTDEDAALLMDDSPSHVKEEALNLLRDARARVITWTPHATHIFQKLDLRLFEVLKRREQYALPFEDDQTTTSFLLRIDRMLRRTMFEPNIWGTFHELDSNSIPVSSRIAFDSTKKS